MSILDEIIAHKRTEVENAKRELPLEALMPLVNARKDFRSLVSALELPGIRVIAEIKRRSPSKGELQPDLDPAELAEQYQAGGAAALSVLTDAKFFGACPDDLEEARASVKLPVLRKEFIIDDYQVYESVAIGADAILLIARILDDETMDRLLQLAHKLGLDVLLEVHDPSDMARALRTGCRLIGINNRDLGTFHTDLTVAMELTMDMGHASKSIPVALSGITSAADVLMSHSAGIRCFLVGESLVRSDDPTQLLRDMLAVGAP